MADINQGCALQLHQLALACWSTNTNGCIRTAAQNEARGWKPPTLEEHGDSGNWIFSQSGVQPTFDPDDYWGGGESDDDLASDASGEAKRSVITTANGVFGYSDDWGGVGSASDPAMAVVRLLHVARQMTDTSRWWTMRWPSNAASLLGRAGDLTTGQTYGPMKKLRHVTAEFSEQLWQETVIRRNERVNHGERDDLRQQWAECASGGWAQRGATASTS